MSPRDVRTPESNRRYVAGPTGSGKTRLLRHWARQYPRQLVLDVTSEWASDAEDAEPFPGEIWWAGNAAELGEALGKAARLPRWRVVVPTEAVAPSDLVRLLVPLAQPGRVSFPQAVGGVALVVDEAAEFAELSVARAVRPLWLRGRHHGLTILAASQRAADVGRMVTSQSETIAVTATSEPIDLAFWRQSLGSTWYEALLSLKQYQAIEIHRPTRRARVITTDGKLVRHLTGPA